MSVRYASRSGFADYRPIDTIHSILYKTRLPFLLVFNKTDVQPHDFALEWMRDFEAFQEALLERRQTHGEEDGPAYMDSLMNSMSLVLDEFYKHLRVRQRCSPRLVCAGSLGRALILHECFECTGCRRVGDDGRRHGRAV